VKKCLRSLVIVIGLLISMGFGVVQAEPVTLKIWDMMSPADEDGLLKAIAAFEEANPNIRIEREKFPFAGFYDKLLTAFAGNSAPDLAPVVIYYIPQMADYGIFVDVTDDVSDLADYYYPAAWDMGTYKGRVVGVPYSMDPRALGVNTAMLDEAGVGDTLATWDDLVNAAGKLTRDSNNDGRTDVYGLSLPSGTHAWVFDVWSIFTAQQGKRLFDDTGKPVFTTTEAENALQYYADFFSQGATTPAGYDVALRDAFVQEKAAMAIDGPWILEEMPRRAPDIDYRLIPIPTPTSGVPATFASVGVWSVFRTSKHPKEAAQFLRFLTEGDYQKDRIFAGKTSPSRVAYQRPEVREYLEKDPRHAEFVAVMDQAIATPKSPYLAEILATALRAEMEAALLGIKPVPEALETAQKKALSIIQ